jgi:hypothetical protein
MYINLAGRRVMPGVRSPEGSGTMARDARAASLRRSNQRMHATRGTTDFMLRRRMWAGA